jgi:hypothetical protein
MTLGFSEPERLLKLKAELMGWELYQVTIDKYHVMFWFENGYCLLNAAFRFSVRSADRAHEEVYDVQAPGDRKAVNFNQLLRRPIVSVEASGDRQLVLTFDSGAALVIHDDPRSRSAWFCRYNGDALAGNAPTSVIWGEDDDEGEDD